MGGSSRILIGARKRRADNTSGAYARRANRLREDAATETAAAKDKIERLREMSVSLASTGLPPGRRCCGSIG